MLRKPGALRPDGPLGSFAYFTLPTLRLQTGTGMGKRAREREGGGGGGGGGCHTV